ncbi:MAG: hypothetical protein A2X37_02775 [Elusimicrobia bacterium GWA2_66_18]|nr:MAG: hypothetical protein A2X37_02775 [Elusimicrobia bacterium GWA2_66_18]
MVEALSGKALRSSNDSFQAGSQFRDNALERRHVLDLPPDRGLPRRSIAGEEVLVECAPS